MTENLKNCPICNSDYISIDSSRSQQYSRVTCGDCGINIGGYMVEEDLVSLWNTRHNELLNIKKELK